MKKQQILIVLLTCALGISNISNIATAEAPEIIEQQAPNEPAPSASKKQIEAVVKLSKKYGWNVSKVDFFLATIGFNFDNESIKYKKYSKAVGLSGINNGDLVYGTKEYSNNGKPYEVDFYFVFDEKDNTKITGAFIMPVLSGEGRWGSGTNTDNSKGMYPLNTKPSKIKQIMTAKYK